MKNVKENEIIEDELLPSNVKLNLGQVNDMYECLLKLKEIEGFKLKSFIFSMSKTAIKNTEIRLKTIDDLLTLLYEENERYNNLALGGNYED